ncbi:MAG: DUF1513 domain-containing protein [Roseibium sp.]|nr:DUF1513 domain-containing protein [Roseibium sp.]
MLNRRQVLATVALSGLPIPAFAGAPVKTAFISCCQTRDGRYGAAFISEDLNVLDVLPIDVRGHATAVSPDGKTAVVFARRPDRLAFVFDIETRQRIHVFVSPEDRHFCGHGFFSQDGALLFATENDYEKETGELGIYAVDAAFRRIGAFATAGIGPHEALLLKDRQHIAVANGGIVTHPDYPRQKLNLATMKPSISLLSAATGDLIETVALPGDFHQLSIRHMAEAANGDIWFGCQYEGPTTNVVPLVGVYRPGRSIKPIWANDQIYRQLNRNIGSVAASTDGHHISVTSPRGGKALTWNTMSEELVSTADVYDVGGVAPKGSGFVLSAGTGLLKDTNHVRHHELAWDNHLSSPLTG